MVKGEYEGGSVNLVFMIVSLVVSLCMIIFISCVVRKQLKAMEKAALNELESINDAKSGRDNKNNKIAPAQNERLQPFEIT